MYICICAYTIIYIYIYIYYYCYYYYVCEDFGQQVCRAWGEEIGPKASKEANYNRKHTLAKDNTFTSPTKNSNRKYI